MALLVRAFPLIRPVEEFEHFVAEVSRQRAGADALYRQVGATHESWYLQQTPAGPWVIAVAKIRDHEEAAERRRGTSEDFSTWFKSEVQRLTGIDPDTEPLGPPTSKVFEWSDSEVAGSDLCA